MYRIIFETKAKNFFKKLDTMSQERVSKKINQLKTNPRIGIPLIGNFRGLWKLRIGDYRFIYKIDDDNLIVVGVNMGNRRNIYK